MSMTIPELHRALRSLRLSGMVASIEARALQVSRHEMNLLEGFSWLVQDEPDRRRSRLLERRHSTSGLSERKDLAAFDRTYNPKRLLCDNLFKAPWVGLVHRREARAPRRGSRAGYGPPRQRGSPVRSASRKAPAREVATASAR